MSEDLAMGCRRLVDKVIVVAGASSGIGRATALRLAAEGAKVVAASPASEKDKIDSLVQEITGKGGQALGCHFDATDDASVARLIDTAASSFGGIDAVHANFADLRILMTDSDVLTVSDEVLERTLDVNLKGMLRITRHALPKLLERGGGAMIYTSSAAAIAAEPVRPCYAMAKAGINALVRHVASGWDSRAFAPMPSCQGWSSLPNCARRCRPISSRKSWRGAGLHAWVRSKTSPPW